MEVDVQQERYLCVRSNTVTKSGQQVNVVYTSDTRETDVMHPCIVKPSEKEQVFPKKLFCQHAARVINPL